MTYRYDSEYGEHYCTGPQTECENCGDLVGCLLTLQCEKVCQRCYDGIVADGVDEIFMALNLLGMEIHV